MSLFTYLRTLSSSKLVIFMFIVSVFMVSWDFTQRILQEGGGQRNTNVAKDIKPIPLPIVSTSIKEKVAKSYAEYTTKSVDEMLESDKGTNGMAASQQKLQTGELDEVFVGNKSLVLKAVVTTSLPEVGNAKVALLLVTDNETNKQKIERYSSDREVYGYAFKIISNTKVELLKTIANKEQRIILSMYKTGV